MPVNLAPSDFVETKNRLEKTCAKRLSSQLHWNAALECLTMPWRSSAKGSRMSEVAAGVTVGGRTLAALEMCAIRGRSKDGFLVDFLKVCDMIYLNILLFLTLYDYQNVPKVHS